MKRLMIITLTLVLAGAFNARADGTSVNLKQSLAAVPAAEMPAKAAELVKGAKSRERVAVAITVVRSGLELSPASAPSLVGAIAKAAPETAPAAAAAAAQQQPKLAAEIARAAAAAAPAKAGKIVAAVCRVVPADYKKVAVAVSQVVPEAGKEILAGIATAIPDLKPGIDAVLTKYSKNLPAMELVLESPVLAANSTSPNGTVSAPRGPVIAPPYVPYSGTTSGLTPSDSGPVPRGGRDYASP